MYAGAKAVKTFLISRHGQKISRRKVENCHGDFALLVGCSSHNMDLDSEISAGRCRKNFMVGFKVDFRISRELVGE